MGTYSLSRKLQWPYVLPRATLIARPCRSAVRSSLGVVPHSAWALFPSRFPSKAAEWGPDHFCPKWGSFTGQSLLWSFSVRWALQSEALHTQSICFSEDELTQKQRVEGDSESGCWLGSYNDNNQVLNSICVPGTVLEDLCVLIHLILKTP